MNPIKKLRALFAILLVVSMLMPLSQCEYPDTINELDQTYTQEQLIIDRYIVSENSTWSQYLWLLAFLAPRQCSHKMLAHKTMQRICTAAKNDAVFLA